MRAIETIVTNFSGAFPNALGINSTGPSTKDGTELIANLFNDYIGVFPQALLNHMAMTPNGNAETATNSQQLDAVIRMMARYGSPHGCIGRPDTDTLHDIAISRGSIPDSTRQYTLSVLAPIAKQGDVAWVAGGIPGTPAGGLMGGTWSPNTEYGVFLIYNPTTKIVDAGFSVYTLISGVPTPTFLPAGYTVYQLIDWVKTNGASEIIQTVTTESGARNIVKQWVTPILDIALVNTLTTARRLDAISVPTGFKSVAKLNILAFDSVSDGVAYIYSPEATDQAPSFSLSPIATCGWWAGTTSTGISNINVMTNTLRQIASRSTVATTDSYYVATTGFEFQRF